jgi:hypothetical protein
MDEFEKSPGESVFLDRTGLYLKEPGTGTELNNMDEDSNEYNDAEDKTSASATADHSEKEASEEKVDEL